MGDQDVNITKPAGMFRSALLDVGAGFKRDTIPIVQY